MALTVHHLVRGVLRPRPGRLVYEPGGHRHLVCHCLLVEVGDELVLVDTGLGRERAGTARAALRCLGHE